MNESTADSRMRAEPGRRSEISPVVVALVIFGVLLVFYWLCGAVLPSQAITGRRSPAEVTGMSLTYSTSPAFMLASMIYLRRWTHGVLDRLVRSGCLSRAACDGWIAQRSPLGPLANLAATFTGVFLGAWQVYWPPVFEDVGSPTMLMSLGIATGNIVTWVVAVHVFSRLGLATWGLGRLGREHAQIDLMRLDSLLPFGRIGTQHVLFVTITVSFSAFQSLDAELRWVNYSAALAAGIPSGLALLLLPMIGIRRSVREAKRRALDGVDEAIEHADRGLEADALRYLSDLLSQRTFIQGCREWPFDTTAFSRIAIYFVIPPIAWIGGALAEVFIQAAL